MGQSAMGQSAMGQSVEPFRQRWPWLGPDLQTLRDSLRPEPLPADRGQPLLLPIGGGDRLLALVDPPLADPLLVEPGLTDLPQAQGEPAPPRGLVLVVHGLGGDSGRQGVRRLALVLQQAGFAVWRLNLRGAGPGRPLARGTYAAACSRDLLPVLAQARTQAAGRPLLAVGLSLGGTVLLNALLDQPDGLDGLACVSSPLDMEACSGQIGTRRNRLYERWLLQRLVAQTLAESEGCTDPDGGLRAALHGERRPRSIRAFDGLVTAPRWGYASVEDYYAAASPLPRLLLERRASLPPTLLLQALDDPWVPAAAACQLAQRPDSGVQVWLTAGGGHNGFHGVRHLDVDTQWRDKPFRGIPWRGTRFISTPVLGRPAWRQLTGSWADRAVAAWLETQVGDSTAAAPAATGWSA